uniref:Uncharacterized protein n=1 Tax=Strongyloides papillosus TaxID=174720 RepID=A0A0N5BH57_STREA
MQKLFYIVLASIIFFYICQPVRSLKYNDDEISSLYSQQIPVSSEDSYKIPYKPYSSYLLGQRFQYRPHGIKRVSEHDINALLRNTWIG